MLVRHAPAPKVAGDPLAVVVLGGEVEEVVDLVVEEEEDGADTKLQVSRKLRPS